MARSGAARVAIGLGISAPLIFCALPPQSAGPLILVAIAPILAGLRGVRASVGLLAAPMLMLLVAAPYELGFVEPVLDQPLPRAATAIFVVFGTSLVLPFIVAVASDRSRWGLGRSAFIAAAGVAGEGVLLFGVPGHLSLALAREPLALAVAATGSIWAVSFLVWWTNASIAGLIVTRQPIHLLPLGITAVIASTCWAVSRPTDDSRPLQHVEVAAIQMQGAPGRTEWIEEHAKASESKGGAKVDMVVWPELAGTRIAPGGSTAGLSELVRRAGDVPFAISFPTPGPGRPYNTALIAHREGVSATYHKRHLYADESRIHAPGTAARTVEHMGIRYALAICFDSCFPSTMRRSATTTTDAGERPDLVLLPTLDPPDHFGVIQAMHAASTPFRAAETGLPIVRADITAVSMIVDGYGHVLAESGVGDDVIRASIPIRRGRTPIAMVTGDAVLHACVATVLLAALVSASGRRRRG